MGLKIKYYKNISLFKYNLCVVKYIIYNITIDKIIYFCKLRLNPTKGGNLMWKDFDASLMKGVLVTGDPDAKKSRRWNYLLLLLVYWQKACLLKVHTSDPYQLGYVMDDQIGKIFSKPFYHNLVRIGVRRENCRFFAIDGDDREISVTIEKKFDRNSSEYSDIRIV